MPMHFGRSWTTATGCILRPGSRRCHYRDIPKSVTELVDDPFRSLAGELRRAGGYAKDTTPFSELIWGRIFCAGA